MAPERERPELQPKPAGPSGSIPMPGPGERVPMPAGPGSARRRAGEKSAGRFGLAAAAILTAGLAAAMVFKGDFRQAQQAAPPAPTAVEVGVEGPLATAPPPRCLPPNCLPPGCRKACRRNRPGRRRTVSPARRPFSAPKKTRPYRRSPPCSLTMLRRRPPGSPPPPGPCSRPRTG